MTHAHQPNPLAEQLLDPELYAGDPFSVYRHLRETAPVAWCESAGFWALTNHHDVSKVGTDPGTFCSSKGILVQEIGTEYDSPPTMMHTDPPAHTRYRRLVQPSFKPTSVKVLEPAIRAMAKKLIAGLPIGEPVDLVATTTVPFPLQVICELLGTDPNRWPTFFEWSEASIPGAGNMTEEERGRYQLDMWEYLIGLATDRRAKPLDDVVSQLAQAELDGEVLSEAELAMFLIQLLVAGNETTRNMLSHGLIALAQNPDQWELLVDDPSKIPSAVEEMLRWSSPVISFMRTATMDTELSGVAIAEGDPVLMIYAAANRDPEVFGSTAETFDVMRDPNPHVAFGFGTHFCLGAPLARLEARVFLEELAQVAPRLLIGGPVVYAPNPIIAGVTQAVVKLGHG